MEKIQTLILLLLIIILSVFVSCSSNDISPADPNAPDLDSVRIQSDGSFTQEFCEAYGLEDKVIMIESKYCGHCQQTLPIFLQSCAQKNIEPIILDLSLSEDRAKMNSYNVEALYTPTFIFGCDYYVGAKDMPKYLSLLSKFKEGE